MPPLVEYSSQSLIWHPDYLGVYIHIPFCLQKCGYCSFYSVAGHRQWFDRLVAAMQEQIRHAGRENQLAGRKVASIFFGGGTPTVLEPDQLALLLASCRQGLACEEHGLEISVEANPATIDQNGFNILTRAGFNRVSLGVQSLDDRELVAIGRLHNGKQALAACDQARKAGCENLSLDLMYGLPGQSIRSWQRTLRQALEVEADHFSVYELTLEQGTPLAKQAERGDLHFPGEEEVLEMLAICNDLLEGKNLRRYEISNYARSGHWCRHNINYWHNGDYLGFGPGAVSCLAGKRQAVIADVTEYCHRAGQGRSVVADQEELPHEVRFRETVIMGLRMVNGISLDELENRFGINAVDYYGQVFDRLREQKLLEIYHGYLRLTRQGFLLANWVMAELV